MAVVFVLLPLALALAAGALWAFARAARRGEFDDLTTPSVRLLTDDEDGAAVDSNTVAQPCSPQSHPLKGPSPARPA